ncbi:Ig-like domain-containing protein [Leptospira sp. WS92.C1]
MITYSTARQFLNVLSVLSILFFLSCTTQKQSSGIESVFSLIGLISQPEPPTPPIEPPPTPQIQPPPVPPTVIRTRPADAGTSIPINANVIVTFSKVINKDSVTTNTENTNCSGTISVSSDNFATCIRMNSAPTSPSGENDTSFLLDPVSFLTVNTQYQIRISETITDEDDNQLTAPVITSFTASASTDIIQPAIQYTFPTPFESVGANTSLLATFSERMNPNSLTVNTTDTTCTGSIQVSDTNFETCKIISLQPVFSNDFKTLVIKPTTPLLEGASVFMKITTDAKDVAGNEIAADHILNFGARESDSNPPTILSGITYPTQNQTDVARNRTLTLRFSEKINPQTFVLNSLDTNCTGVVQVSADDFNTCVRLNENFQYGRFLGSDHSIFLMDLLEPQTTYKIRVTNGIQDLAGNAFAGFTQTNGFTTGSNVDTTPPTVTTTTHNDGGVISSFSVNVEISFSEEMDVNTFTNSGNDGNCSGSLQISADNFNTCIQNPGLGIFIGNRRILISSGSSTLQSNANYKIRIKGTVKDAANNSMGADFTQTTGFRTPP